MREINELIRNMGIRSEVINFDNAALSYMPAPVINAINKYNCRRNEAGRNMISIGRPQSIAGN